MNTLILIWNQLLKRLQPAQIQKQEEVPAEKQSKKPTATPTEEQIPQKRLDISIPPDCKTEAPPAQPDNEEKANAKTPLRLTQEVREFLQANYDFRYNLLTEETEFRPAGKRNTAFTPISKRELNTFCMEAHEQGIGCWDKDLSRYVFSTYIPAYHPFHLYIDELPDWDGVDRLEALAQRVSGNPLWTKSFHTWMLGLTAQWAGMTDIHANSVAPILVSSEQGRQKSTFCKALMPPTLARYYMDNLQLTAQGKPERLLAELGLINMDEFDKYAMLCR